MKDRYTKIGLETEMETGKHGVKRDRRVCVRGREQCSGGRSKRVEKVYYMSNAGVSGCWRGRMERFTIR